ncbi:hypothetical protein HHK36_007753 [Tetracentron sinense]|uniref:Uncharacterized protein n=1 Tax=Tetracentron sinense TaxID=13715 RepID=A0A835DJD3_TETSI|nr:hypothetical protein HHK36_007753 [Tetracentron sinense]
MKKPLYSPPEYRGKWLDDNGLLDIVFVVGWKVGSKPLPVEIIHSLDLEVQDLNKYLDAYYEMWSTIVNRRIVIKVINSISPMQNMVYTMLLRRKMEVARALRVRHLMSDREVGATCWTLWSSGGSGRTSGSIMGGGLANAEFGGVGGDECNGMALGVVKTNGFEPVVEGTVAGLYVKNGNFVSSNFTWRETKTRLSVSRMQRYPL